LRTSTGLDQPSGFEPIGETGSSVFCPNVNFNLLKTPHIALLALDIMDRLGIRYRVPGGPSHCCGIMHLRASDTESTGQIATYALDQMANRHNL
jgi:Fe-S oxidoreductase